MRKWRLDEEISRVFTEIVAPETLRTHARGHPYVTRKVAVGMANVVSHGQLVTFGQMEVRRTCNETQRSGSLVASARGDADFNDLRTTLACSIDSRHRQAHTQSQRVIGAPAWSPVVAIVNM